MRTKTDVMIKPAGEEHRDAIRVLLQTYFLDADLDVGDFIVAQERESRRILGCAGLSRESLCELRCIAVHPSHRNRGIGRKLVQYLLEQVDTDIYLRTTVPVFFKRVGFRQLSDSFKKTLWEDCAACELFRECTKSAMIYSPSLHRCTY